MKHTFLDGTISFREAGSRTRGWIYDLMANFSPKVGPDIPVARLERLQKMYGGELDISRQNDGSIRICSEVIAHGPESAFKQARDLRSLLLAVLGLRTNVASTLAV